MPAQNVRFGPFRLDLQTGELFHNGSKVRLQEQPFQVLKMLLEHPGEVVTREDIRRTLWSDDTIVEFDNSVNAAIKKLRLALGDSAESPKYVETLTRKGYRFISPVEASESGGSNGRSFTTQESAPESMIEVHNLEGASNLDSPAFQVTAQGIVEAETPSLEEQLIGSPQTTGELESDLKRPGLRSHIKTDVGRPEAFDGENGIAAGLDGSVEQVQKRSMRARWVEILGDRAVFRIMLLLSVASAISVLVVWLRSPLPNPTVLRVTQITHDRRMKGNILLTDGPRIYFTEFVAGGHPIPVSLSTSGGEPVPVPMSLPKACVLDISHEGSELLVNSAGTLWTNGALWVLPTEGGTARRLGDLEAAEAAWSPDGERLVYSKGKDLYVAKSDGTGSRKLATMPGQLVHLRWAPDGERLTVSIENKPPLHTALWELSADGSNLHPRFSDWTSDSTFDGCWTFDGKFFLFDSDRGGASSIWAVRERGGFFEKWSREPTRLTQGPMHSLRPLPSEDGKRVFFVTIYGKPFEQLMRYDSKSTQWAPYLSGISAEQVAFSRDGQWTTYVSFPEANLILSRVDGSQKLQLTSPPVQCSKPRWSPDGRQIAFMARTPGSAWKIWVASTDGGSTRPLMAVEPIPQKTTSGGALQGNANCAGECDPDWSPDGNSLVFYRQPSPEEEAANAMPIHILDLRTNRVRRLSGSGDRYYPHWSPDGRYLAATADHCNKVVLFDFKLQTWVKLAEGEVYSPIWSHDGQSVCFIDWTKQRSQRGYYRVGIRNHRLERVTDLDTPLPHQSGIDGGWWVGLAPDDSPIALFQKLDVGHNEVYALDWVAP